MIELKGVSKIYKTSKKDVQALKDVNLKMQAGSFVSILGYSGSGKTSLVSLLGGMENPTAGKINYHGKDISLYQEKDWVKYRKNHIGFIFQKFHLIKHLTAYQNIMLSMSLSGMDKKEKEKKTLELLELVGMLSHKDHFPSELSGGQKQRIAIARALSNNPPIILADEPTGSLDPKTSKEIMDILKSLSNDGKLVIVVTHDEALAYEYANRVIELDQGKIVSDETISKVNESTVPIHDSQTKLPFLSSLQLAYNNLKIKKKSSLFVLLSLIPTFIFLFVLSSFAMNIQNYYDDLSPLIDTIIGSDQVYYLSPVSEYDFESQVAYKIRRVKGKRIEFDNIVEVDQFLAQPFSQETLDSIQSIDGVETVIKPRFLSVEIKGNPFVIVGLVDEAYKNYQNDFQGNYPKNETAGIFMSQEASKILLGKYVRNPKLLEGQELEMTILAYNSLPLVEAKSVDVPVEKVFDNSYSSTEMKTYMSGYIYVTSQYFDQLTSGIKENLSFAIYQNDQPVGGQNLYDPMFPLRSKTALDERLSFLKLPIVMEEIPASTFPIKYTIITNENFGFRDLSEYGIVGNSRFNDLTYKEAVKLNKRFSRMIVYTRATIIIILIIPCAMVLLVLYVSIISRAKEIGLLKAIGSRNIDIVKIFTMESGILGLVSGIIAMIILLVGHGYLIEYLEQTFRLTYILGSNPFNLSIGMVIGSYLFGLMIVTSLGILPGLKASRLTPNVLLRKVK